MALLALPLSLGRSASLPRAIMIATILFSPLEWVGTRYIVRRARRSLRKYPPKVTIGITGSFGKTTTKELVSAILSRNFRVEKTPENTNTLLGIANWIARTRFDQKTALVVEMGAYQKGDIARITKLIHPNIGILTGINEAHQERFGSLENTIATKLELLDGISAAPRIGFWNERSSALHEAIPMHMRRWQDRGITLVPYTEEGTSTIHLAINKAAETSLAVEISKIGEQSWTIGGVVHLFGKHHGFPLAAAVAVADALGFGPEDIRRGLTAIKQIPRRLATSYGAGGSLIVDDSYNITLDGVRAAISALESIPRRKIGIFAGIPEVGIHTAELNLKLGELLAPVFAIILLRKTPVSQYVAEGIQRSDAWKRTRLIWYTHPKEIEKILEQTVEPQDCVYFSAYDFPAIYL